MSGIARTYTSGSPASPRYRQVRFAPATYTDVVDRARLALFVVLGAIYVLAVILLETAIMPWYVYRPLRLMLDADQATHRGDREHELIPDEFILGDEVGQIMRSRNATVAELREHEDNLAAAIRQLEEQDRLASLGLLSASVAHELNTPLAVLHGSIEKLKETTKDPHTLERLSRMERVTHGCAASARAWWTSRGSASSTWSCWTCDPWWTNPGSSSPLTNARPRFRFAMK